MNAEDSDALAPPSLLTSPQMLLLQAVVQSAMDAIVALDANQRIVLFNPAAERMFRCLSAEALGKPLDRFLPDRYRAAHRQHVVAFGLTGDTSRSMGLLRPLTAIRADGAEFPIEATIARVAIDGIPHYVAIVRDVTARQLAEASLKRQVDLLNLAYDAIFTWAWNGSITFWNAGAERLYGYSAVEAIGQRSHELLHTRHPTGFANIARILEQEQVWEGELTHRRRDGSEVLVESRHVLVDGEDGRYVLEANRDVTRRKRAEAEYAGSAAREAVARAEAETAAAARDHLQDILDDLPGGIVLMNAPDAQIELVNAAMRQLVWDASDNTTTLPVYGQDFMFAQADGAPLTTDERPEARVLRGERVRNLQLVLLRAGGMPVPISVYATLLHDGPASIDRVIVFVQDVTQLRQAEQLKDDFLALVSHELRTPLSVIHGGAQILVNKPHLDAETRMELLSDVVAESERLEQLLGNLLALTEITAGRLQASLEPVLLESLVSGVVAEFQNRSPQHTFAIDLVTPLPPAEADPDLLEGVLRNLYENAIKYAPQGGVIRTTLAVEDGYIAIRVIDEGIGIAPEHVKTVFERFRRVGGDSRVRGMGLGLYLCRGLVEAQGGHIEASSPGLGRGSTFTVTLPIGRGWADSEQG